MRAVNLIPADQRSGASVGLGRSQGGAYALLAAVIVLALFGLLYGKARHEISSRSAQIAALNSQVQQAQTDAGSLASYESLNATSEKRLAAAESLIDSRFDWAHAFHELGDVLPAHTTITSLSGAVASSASAGPVASGTAPGAATASAASTVASATPPGSVPTFSLTGCARSQPEVALALEQLRLMDGAKEVTLSSSTSAAAGTGTQSTGDCTGDTFAVTLAFDPLPAASAYATKPTSKTVAAQSPATGSSK